MTASDPLVSHEELALAMETIRQYVLISGAMSVAAATDRQTEIMGRFREADEQYLKFIAALRGE